MTLLAIDTAANICAVCLYDRHVLASRSEDIGTGHAERLIDMIGEVLAEAGTTYKALTCIAVSVGPGSFTGVRIGVAAARGLALALGIPAVGVSTLEAIAADARGMGPVMALIDAKRGWVYCAVYGGTGDEIVAPMLTTREEARELALQHVATIVEGRTGTIETFARLGASKSPEEKPKPLYLRAADAKPQAGFALPHKAPA